MSGWYRVVRSNGGNGLYGLCATVGPDVVLSCNRNN